MAAPAGSPRGLAVPGAGRGGLPPVAPPSGRVAFVGSRSLPRPARPLVAACVRSLLRRGALVGSGCSAGADWHAVSTCLRLGAPCAVFAAGSPSGSGFWARSAGPFRWGRLAPFLFRARLPVGLLSVSWWSGGACTCRRCLFGAPVRCPSAGARFAARSAALVSWAAAGGRGSGVVAFVVAGPHRSPGSWGALQFALASGLPVAVFPVSLGGPLPPLAAAGCWVPAAAAGPWSSAWRWVPGLPSGPLLPGAISASLPSGGGALLYARGLAPHEDPHQSPHPRDLALARVRRVGLRAQRDVRETRPDQLRHPHQRHARRYHHPRPPLPTPPL